MSKKRQVSETKNVIHDLDVKMSNDDGIMTVSGYAAVFGNVDSYGDIIEKGAFKKTLSESRERAVKFLWQHDMHVPIGTLVDLKEDDKGLYFDAKFAATQQAKDAHELAKIGAIDGVSIGYRTIQSVSEDVQNADGWESVRMLKEIDLMEISLVTFEANTQAKITNVKSELLALIEESASLAKADATATLAKADAESRNKELLHSLKEINQTITKKGL